MREKILTSVVTIAVLINGGFSFPNVEDRFSRITNVLMGSESEWTSASSMAIETPTTPSPTFADENPSAELPDTAQYDSLPTKKPKFISIFANNITFENQRNLSYYTTLLKQTIPPQHRLEYLEALSDRMREENKFQQDDWQQEFSNLFYWTLRTHKNSPFIWSKKTEKKLLKRFLKFAIAADALANQNIVDAPTTNEIRSCEDIQAKQYLQYDFYSSMLLALTEAEGYEILTEVIQTRNLTLTFDLLRDLQCLYYKSFGGMQNGRAYMFSKFDDDWDRRNSIFGKPVILQSIRSMVREVAGFGPKSGKISDFMETILGLLPPEYRSKLEEEKKSSKSPPKNFYQITKNLEGKLMGMVKFDIFVDIDSKDVLMSTGTEALLDLTTDQVDPQKVIFDPFSRHDWNQLQKFRAAGVQIFEKYNSFFSRLVSNKIREIYQERGLTRTFSSAFHHIRLLPTGPLILEGFETLNDLMERTPPRDAVSNANRIKNFKQSLQFLRGLYSTNDDLLNSLPPQIQLLTNPELNKNMKLMLKFQSPHAPDFIFMEVGVSGGELAFRQFPYLQSEGEVVEDFVNAWQFQLGYFKGYSEAWQEPVIKAEILLANETEGGLSYKWRDQMMVFEGQGTMGTITGNGAGRRVRRDVTMGATSVDETSTEFQWIGPLRELPRENAIGTAPPPHTIILPTEASSVTAPTTVPTTNSPMVDNQKAPMVTTEATAEKVPTERNTERTSEESTASPTVTADTLSTLFRRPRGRVPREGPLRSANEERTIGTGSWLGTLPPLPTEVTIGNGNGKRGFWDLSLLPNGQSFQLMYQGKLEIFFKVLLDQSGTVPIGLKGEHHVPGFLPEGFKPAEFFVVPSDDLF